MAESNNSHMAGWNPHRLTEAGREPSSFEGSNPSSDVKLRPLSWRVTWRLSVRARR